MVYSTGIKNRAIIPDDKAGIDRLSIGYRSGPMDRDDNQVKCIRYTICVTFQLGTIIKCLFYIDHLTLYDTSEAPYALNFTDIFFFLGLTAPIICEVLTFEQKIKLGRKYQFFMRQKPYRSLFTDAMAKFHLVFCQDNNLPPISTACLPP